MRIFLSLVTALAIAVPALYPVDARSEDSFYQGKTLTFIVAADAGGGYDLYARALAPYLKQHLPGHPTVIVQNMPGAGGIVMANHMARNAAADGTVIGLMLSPVALNQLTRPKQIGYDARKFVWLGTIDAQTNVLFVGTAKSSVRSLADAKKAEVVIGATNANSFLYQEPKIMNALLQTRFKVVGGYKGVRDLDLALERGEIEGHVSPWSTVKSEHPDWLKDGKVVNIISTGAEADDLPGVPRLADLVHDSKDKEVVDLIDMSSILGRSVAAPPGLAAERTAMLRTAIGAAVNDPAFAAEMAQRMLPVRYRSGEKLQAYVEEALKTPPEAVATFLKIVNSQ